MTAVWNLAPLFLLALFIAAIGGWMDTAKAGECEPGAMDAHETGLGVCSKEGRWVSVGPATEQSFRLGIVGASGEVVVSAPIEFPTTLTVSLDVYPRIQVTHGGRVVLITPELLDKLESLQ